MPLIDFSVEARGFAPVSIGLALRTVATCPAAGHRPDARLLCGIGTLTVMPDDDGSYRFSTDARCLGEGDTVRDLLDWLEPQLPATQTVVSWDNWGSVPRRLLALADPARHPGIVAAAADTAGRWRDLPRAHTPHLRQAKAMPLPCFCGPNADFEACDAATPLYLLPDPGIAAEQLIGEAIAGWRAWAAGHGYFDDAEHPAQIARRALDRWLADQRTPR